jgi:hypothetical protein
MRIDFTLTLPGLSEVDNIMKLAQEFDVDILAKVVFSFGPDIILSPLALPRELLHKKLDELIPNTHGAMQAVLLQLKQRPTFAEEYPDSYRAGLIKGKQRVLQLERIRNDQYTLGDILAEDKDIKEWYEAIVT